MASKGSIWSASSLNHHWEQKHCLNPWVDCNLQMISQAHLGKLSGKPIILSPLGTQDCEKGLISLTTRPRFRSIPRGKQLKPELLKAFPLFDMALEPISWSSLDWSQVDALFEVWWGSCSSNKPFMINFHIHFQRTEFCKFKRACNWVFNDVLEF